MSEVDTKEQQHHHYEDYYHHPKGYAGYVQDTPPIPMIIGTAPACIGHFFLLPIFGPNFPFLRRLRPCFWPLAIPLSPPLL